jgi:hypothetical protein
MVGWRQVEYNDARIVSSLSVLTSQQLVVGHQVLTSGFGGRHMTTTIYLRDVVDEMEAFDDSFRSFLNRATGELATVSIEELSAAEEVHEPCVTRRVISGRLR